MLLVYVYNILHFVSLFQSIFFLVIKSLLENSTLSLTRNSLIHLAFTASPDCIIFSRAWFNFVLFGAVTCCTGWQPKSHRLHPIPQVCSKLYHLGLCKYTLWCFHNNKIAQGHISQCISLSLSSTRLYHEEKKRIC